MVTADAAEVSAQIAAADGLLFGTPTILGEALKPIWDLTTSMFPPVHGGKLASAFGSYGWSGEGVPHIVERLKQLRMKVVDGYKVKLKPSEKELTEAVEFGYNFGLKLLRKDEPVKASAKSTLVKCLVCGEIFDSSIETCPVCGVGRENFVPVDSQDTGFRMDTMEKFVILGGGTAALNAAKAIRQRNATAAVTMISEETELPYDRPMLTKNMFGAVCNGAIASVGAEWYKENNVTLLLGSKVERIDAGRKEVVLADGTAYPYDKCIYALGSYSFVPPIKGKELPEVTPVRTIADVMKVRSFAEGAKSAVVIGGGVLGLEAAWELRKEKLDVTVLEGAPVPMAGKVDAETANLLIEIAAKNGITIKTGAKIAEIAGNGHVDGVLLEGGEKIPADLVIISTGVRANIAVAEDAGLITERAVVVNEKMETGVEGIYACGDCAQFNGANIAIWPVASEMGRIAGANAAGEALPYRPETQGMTFHGINTALFAIGDVGTKPDAQYKILEIRDDKKSTLEKYYFVNNVVCGAILLGDTSKMATASEAIKAQKTFKEIF